LEAVVSYLNHLLGESTETHQKIFLDSWIPD